MASETGFEYTSDLVLGIIFLLTTIVAAKRISSSQSQGGTETTVVTAFYSLIFTTAAMRALWFLIPNSIMQPSYTPSAVMAFSKDYPSWFGAFLSELVLTIGSLCLFSIFILILVYWADILKKYFFPGARRSKPMNTFVTIVALLVWIEIGNSALFLMREYSTEGMILVNAILLALVSVICVAQITIFSHRFRTVLKTLGAINQVSTESQVKRIVWITVTGNAFFITRAVLECMFAYALLYYYVKHGRVDKVFSHKFWDIYVFVKYGSEIAILCLMLYILKSRFSTNSASTPSSGLREVYDRIPETEGGSSEKAPLASNAVIV